MAMVEESLASSRPHKSESLDCSHYNTVFTQNQRLDLAEWSLIIAVGQRLAEWSRRATVGLPMCGGLCGDAM